MAKQINFAENQRKRDTGNLTLEECYQIGQTHAAYDWGRSNWFGYPWTEEQRASYRKGWEDYHKQNKR